MTNNVVVISRSGHEMTLKEWQKFYGLSVDSDFIGAYFSLSELRFKKDMERYGKLVVNELLMRVLDRFRSKVGVPVTINAFNRDEAKQAELKAQGFRAATVSPHVVCMAADIDTKSSAQTDSWVAILQAVAIELGIKVRIGYKQYQAEPTPQTFIHVDVCPEYYAAGKPFHSKAHPAVWEKQITW